jgi:hypothetical protein
MILWGSCRQLCVIPSMKPLRHTLQIAENLRALAAIFVAMMQQASARVDLPIRNPSFVFHDRSISVVVRLLPMMSTTCSEPHRVFTGSSFSNQYF